MKKALKSTILSVLLIGLLANTLSVAQATEISPRYTGIATLISTLVISDTGRATCNGKASLWNGYTANVTVELKQDGTTIETWTSSGSELVSAGGIYYVKSGHTYVVTTSVTVYNENGMFVESHFKDSPSKDY